MSLALPQGRIPNLAHAQLTKSLYFSFCLHFRRLSYSKRVLTHLKKILARIIPRMGVSSSFFFSIHRSLNLNLFIFPTRGGIAMPSILSESKRTSWM
jgi:hypothetical protein